MNHKIKSEYDFSQARRATEIPHLNRLREQQLLDEDVQKWLASQDTTTKIHINQLIRQVMAIATH
ncbi:hypothetical protein SAMN02745664_12319 [Moraxella cuniculi DSM 21768]|uniref:Uncharacterized protein n=1 Tax=Moraxella cuniculi DSM 21768 TaxID=1122245 RepID=A0A1N7G4C5_9GAMM|nr:hypothetical protein [Moraxella cuniculi]OOS03267.1 hypothetical protein B0189_09700 [Moraxella cuniculi]SIS07412.1 hypothetical protein SAMN02745664_12319 [Moraxella cuniculi DSM 21768]